MSKLRFTDDLGKAFADVSIGEHDWMFTVYTPEDVHDPFWAVAEIDDVDASIVRVVSTRSFTTLSSAQAWLSEMYDKAVRGLFSSDVDAYERELAAFEENLAA